MYYRPGQSMTFDSDGLQADVMRFMAIIAFCLIAILALVQNVEPPVPIPKIDPVPELVQPSAPLATPPPVETLEEMDVVVEPQRVKEPQRVYEEPQRVYEDPPQTIYKEQPQTVYKEPPQALDEETPQTVYEEQPQTVYEEQPQALSLRFATDDDFVALISADKIQLYARAGTEYYRMGAGFGVTLTPAAGALYELLPASIPAKISRIFNRVVTADGYLVALPSEMQNELNRYLHEMSDETRQGGTLVIHRNGHLSYEK